MSGRWEYFPSVDQVLNEVERQQDARRQESADREWISYKANQLKAEMEGRMATDEDYAYMRKRLRELFGDPNAKQAGSNSTSKGGNGK